MQTIDTRHEIEILSKVNNFYLKRFPMCLLSKEVEEN
jgi:hypothetical protein